MEKAQVGDLIRITKALKDEHVGSIVEVIGVTDSVAEIERIDTVVGIAHSNYVIHRKAGEEDSEECRPAREFLAEIRAESDAVNPQHYKQGRVEVIDIIEDAVEGATPFEAVCQANVLKYALRYRGKNGVEDLRKAKWYLDRLITYLDDQF